MGPALLFIASIGGTMPEAISEPPKAITLSIQPRGDVTEVSLEGNSPVDQRVDRVRRIADLGQYLPRMLAQPRRARHVHPVRRRAAAAACCRGRPCPPRPRSGRTAP